MDAERIMTVGCVKSAICDTPIAYCYSFVVAFCRSVRSTAYFVYYHLFLSRLLLAFKLRVYELVRRKRCKIRSELLQKY